FDSPWWTAIHAQSAPFFELMKSICSTNSRANCAHCASDSAPSRSLSESTPWNTRSARAAPRAFSPSTGMSGSPRSRRTCRHAASNSCARPCRAIGSPARSTPLKPASIIADPAIRRCCSCSLCRPGPNRYETSDPGPVPTAINLPIITRPDLAGHTFDTPHHSPHFLEHFVHVLGLDRLPTSQREAVRLVSQLVHVVRHRRQLEPRTRQRFEQLLVPCSRLRAAGQHRTHQHRLLRHILRARQCLQVRELPVRQRQHYARRPWLIGIRTPLPTARARERILRHSALLSASCNGSPTVSAPTSVVGPVRAAQGQDRVRAPNSPSCSGSICPIRA